METKLLDNIAAIDVLVQKRDTIALKEYLSNQHETIKGQLFEILIKKLYEGNGWQAEIKGGRGDLGADIIVRHPSEPHKVKFIIQAKNLKTKLTKKDTVSELNQFISEASKKYNCNQYRLISLNGFVEDASHFEKYNLRLETWAHIENLCKSFKKSKLVAPDIGLHSHNKITYQNVKEIWKTDKRVAIIQATGTGKSYLIFKALSEFIGKKKILIAPSKVIIQQFIENPDYGWLIDNSVNAFLYHNKKKFTDEKFNELKAELIILDEFHRVGADQWEQKIQKLLAHNPEAYILGTTATPIRYLDGRRDMSEELFFGNKATELQLPRAIVEKILPNPKYIASLITLNEEIQHLLKELEKSRISVEEKKKLKDEIENQKLDWEKSKGVPDILKKHLTGKSFTKFLVFCEDIKHLDKMEIEVEGWFQKAGFADRVKYRVHSKLPLKRNRTVISNFEKEKSNNKISLLFAVDMLNEGLHISSVDGVILLRPTESPIIFYQQIGRCLQVGNEDPIIFDLVNNFNSIKATNFLNDLNKEKVVHQKELSEDGVIDDIPEFKVVDETKEIVELFDRIEARLNTWAFWFELLKEYYSKHHHSRPKHKEKFKNENLGFWVGEQRRKKHLLDEKQISQLETLNFDWGEERKIGPIDRVNKLRDNLKLLEEFFLIHGNSNVSFREPKDQNKKRGWSKTLAVFVNTSLRPIWKKRLEEDTGIFTYVYQGQEIHVLEFLKAINFSWDPKNSFPEHLSELKKYKEKHGDVLVPTQGSEYPKLGRWVNKVRMIYTNGIKQVNGDVVWPKHSTLLKSEIEELEKLGFVWTLRKDNWEENFDALKAFYLKNGHSAIGPSDDQPLYNWRYGQIKRQKNLTATQRKKLATIEFDYNINRHDQSSEERLQQIPKPVEEKTTHDYQWEIMLEKLRVFKEQHKNFLIPKNNKENKQLSSWAITQRIARNRNKLSKERIDKLNLIEFPWSLPKGRKKLSSDPKLLKVSKPKKVSRLKITKPSFEEREKMKWLKMFDQLLTFKINNDHTAIPRTSIENQRLAYWLIDQRKLFRKGQLSKEKIAKFKHVGIDLSYERKDAYKKMWMANYNKYIAYRAKHGNKNPSSRKKETEKLGQWVLMQRWEKKKGELEPYKVELLNKIGFSWDRLEFSGGQPDDVAWLEMYGQLEVFKKQHNHCGVPQLYKNNPKLGRWVNDQRLYSKGRTKVNGKIKTLSQDRKILLEKIGFIWDMKDFEWEQQFTKFQAYYKKHKTFKGKQSDKEYSSIYNWLYRMKKYGTTKERLSKLKSIGCDITGIKIIAED